MSKRKKVFRGQRTKEIDHVGCSCFLCVGHDRSNIYVQKEKEASKQIKEALQQLFQKHTGLEAR